MTHFVQGLFEHLLVNWGLCFDSKEPLGASSQGYPGFAVDKLLQGSVLLLTMVEEGLDPHLLVV